MLGVRTAGFVVDFVLFNLLAAFGASTKAASIAALLVSSGLVFGVNLNWTFSHRGVRLEWQWCPS